MASVSMDSLRPPWAALHPAEIASREFPRARKGFDPDAVRGWLRTVAAAVEALERELEHVRSERDRLESALRRAGEEPATAGVRAALLDARLRRRARGYDRSEVESLLESAAAEIARLETRTAVLEAEAAHTREASVRDREAAARDAALAETIARLERELSAIRSQVGSFGVANGVANGVSVANGNGARGGAR